MTPFRTPIAAALLLAIPCACGVDSEDLEKLARSAWNSYQRERSEAVAPAPGKPDLEKSRSGVSLSWLGHGSVVLDLGGTRVLIDPVLSDRVMVFKRTVAAPIEPEDLRAVDLVLITDANYDHLDRVTLERLPKEAEVITAPGTRDRVADLMFRRVRVIDWGDTLQVANLRIESLAAGSGGRNSPIDPGLYRKCSGYVLSAGDFRVLYASVPADTSALYDALDKITKIDLALLPIGPPGPPWPDKGTFPPEAAARLAREIEAARIVPIHYGTFVFGDDDPDSLLARFETAADSLGIADRISVLKIGETLL